MPAGFDHQGRVYQVNRMAHTHPEPEIVILAGGQILVKIIGFDSKEASDYSSDAFPAQIPYLDITFKDKSGETTANFEEISNSEASMNLAIGYSAFLSGFLIPISDLAGLKENAKAQNEGFMAGTINIQQGINTLTITFTQESKAQITRVTYDIKTGILVSSEVSNDYGPDLKIALSGYDNTIPGFSILPFLSISVLAIMVLVLIKYKKR